MAEEKLDVGWFEARGIPHERAETYADACAEDDVDSTESLRGLLSDAWFAATFVKPGDRGKIKSYFDSSSLSQGQNSTLRCVRQRQTE